jgi:choline dehydrogenase
MQYPAIDWSIAVQHQPQLLGLAADQTVQAGKTFGGGSARNYMAYQRGTVGSYQEWASNVGDSSFTFDKLLPYFKKSANFTPPNYAKRGPGTEVLYNASDFSASGGPLHVSYSNFVPPAAPFFKEAFKASNFTQIAGMNGGQLIGWAEDSLSIDPRSETRSSSETSFLQQALDTTSLTVYSNTLAEQILFNETTASGVVVKAFGQRFTLSAKQEIIVSTGVFRTPQLLMVSGIGPKSTLESLGIPVVSDLAGVGQGLWDQPLFGQLSSVLNCGSDADA